MTTTPRFERPMRIRFSHCDPAGIVFFPQYLVMFNNLVEDWVTEGLGISYADLIGRRRIGMPTVSLQCEFKAVSRIGDDVMLALWPTQIGGASLRLALSCHDAKTERVQIGQVIVFTDLNTHRPLPIPDDLRLAMLAFQQPRQ